MYTTQYNFDSFGRLHTVTIPDNEVITHRYDSGGNLNSIDGRLNGHPYQYLERLDYDKFEQRVYLKVGNGVETKYAYDPDNRRLETLKAGSPGKSLMQDIAYGYDLVGNIKSLIDSAPIPKSNVYGGQSTQHFDYDDLYRLVKADGVYTTAREEQKYTLAMAYDAIHNITHKNQLHTVGKVGGTSPKTETATTYDWGYTYRDNNHTQPHAPTHIGERSFDYDANGNQTGWQNDTNGSRRTIVWDEDNRIREVQDPKHGAAFSYDDKGERKLRKSQYGETAYITQYFSVRNGAIASTHVYAGTSRIVTKVGAGTPVGKVTTTIQGTGNLTDTGTTMGDVIVITADGTTTTGSATTSPTTSTTLSPASGRELERGQSGEGNFPGQGLEHRSDRANEVARNTEKNKHLNGGDPGGIQGSANSNKGGHGNAAGTSNNPGADTGTGGGDTGGGSGTGGNTGGGNTGGGTGTGDGMEFIYFYHPDHLGSTGYVTDEKALRYEHITYFPFGETWVQEATATWRVPYQFTGKEMDSETGLYYFGARYYDPRTSVWQSADPILGSYLRGKPNGGVYRSVNLAFYAYVGNNPVIYNDPDGMAKIMIDPGHGDHNDQNSMVDPGAVAKHGGKTYKEKDMALSFAKAVGKELTDRGHTVAYTRTGNVDDKELEKLQWRVDAADEGEADAFVSIHLDSAGAAASGLSVYANKKGEDIKQGVEDKFEAIDVRNPHAKSLHVLREQKDRPSVLIEAGFITNNNDVRVIEGSQLAKEVAAGIDAGLK